MKGNMGYIDSFHVNNFICCILLIVECSGRLASKNIQNEFLLLNINIFRRGFYAIEGTVKNSQNLQQA